MLVRHSVFVVLILANITVPTALADNPGRPPPPPPSTQPAAIDAAKPLSHPSASSRPAPRTERTALYAARSKDGLAFQPERAVVAKSAASPALIRLPDDRLLLVFERLAKPNRSGEAGLAYSISTNAGRTWDKPRPLPIHGLPPDAGPATKPCLTTKPDGGILLHVVCRNRRAYRSVFAAEIRLRDEDPPPAATQPAQADAPQQPATAPADSTIQPPRPAHQTTAACRVLGRVDLGPRSLQIDDPVVAWIDAECHLYGRHTDLPTRCYHAVSPDGLAFHRLDDLPAADMGFGGSMVQTPAGLRLYAASRSGVISAVSQDGKTWTREKNLRLPAGEDPAVVLLPDKSWLMVYAGVPSDSRTRRPADQDDGSTSPQPPQGDASTWEQADAAPAASPGSSADQPDMDAASEADETEQLTPVEQVPDSSETPAEATSVGPDFLGFEYTECGVPIPDFEHPVDYYAWLAERHDPSSVPDNAWNYYAALIFDPDQGPFPRSNLPVFVGMFSDNSHVGPPFLWNPADHPEWEHWHEVAVPYAAAFADAASHADYVRPLLMNRDRANETGPDSSPQPDDDGFDKLLIGVLLPDLSSHRAMVKQMLSDAWRAPDGRPDSDAMVNALEASLGSAQHLANSDILIESLLSIAERNFVEQNARWALQQGVFSSPEELERVLDVLATKDRPMNRPEQYLVGELACSLDMTQYVFGVGEAAGDQTMKPERLEKIFTLAGDDENLKPPTQDEIAATTARQVTQNFIDYYQGYSEMAARGYPEVKSKDIDEMAARYATDNYVARIMLPSLSHYYKVTARQEASRRATQLSYAIHLHKARTGQWPQSLDELPPRYTQDVRTDPFSGRDFVYHPSADGFTLYSTSENGADDGGVHHSRWDDDGDPSDDHVFWPPQR